MDKDATIRRLEQELSRVKQENERLREELARKDKKKSNIARGEFIPTLTHGVFFAP